MVGMATKRTVFRQRQPIKVIPSTMTSQTTTTTKLESKAGTSASQDWQNQFASFTGGSGNVIEIMPKETEEQQSTWSCRQRKMLKSLRIPVCVPACVPACVGLLYIFLKYFYTSSLHSVVLKWYVGLSIWTPRMMSGSGAALA
jgi:hypothetical protein